MGFFSSLARSLRPSNVIKQHKKLNPVKVTARVVNRGQEQVSKHGDRLFELTEKNIFRGRGPGWALNWRKHASQLSAAGGLVGASYRGGYLSSRRQGATPGTAFRRELRNFGRSAAAISVVYGGIAAAGGSSAAGGGASAAAGGSGAGAAAVVPAAAAPAGGGLSAAELIGYTSAGLGVVNSGLTLSQRLGGGNSTPAAAPAVPDYYDQSGQGNFDQAAAGVPSDNAGAFNLLDASPGLVLAVAGLGLLLLARRMK